MFLEKGDYKNYRRGKDFGWNFWGEVERGGNNFLLFNVVIP